jgi:hypothetical protein
VSAARLTENNSETNTDSNMNDKDIVRDTKDLYNEFMEIPRALKDLGWKALIPASMLLGLVFLVWHALTQ